MKITVNFDSFSLPPVTDVMKEPKTSVLPCSPAAKFMTELQQKIMIPNLCGESRKMFSISNKHKESINERTTQLLIINVMNVVTELTKKKVISNIRLTIILLRCRQTLCNVLTCRLCSNISPS